MKRREALKTTAFFMGAALSAGTISAVMSGCQVDSSDNWSPIGFTADEDALIQVIADLIIPKTDTPGASDAQVNRFIDLAVNKVYSLDDQKAFKDRLPDINRASQSAYTKNFVALDSDQQTEILQSLADAARDDREHIFNQIKELTVAGFFTSEIGMKQALKYDPIPTAYNGCIDYDEIGGLWALDSGRW